MISEKRQRKGLFITPDFDDINRCADAGGISKILAKSRKNAARTVIADYF
jgi:hypothetical protein